MENKSEPLDEQVIDKIKERMELEYICKQMDKQLVELMTERSDKL